jgi:predicted ferric reductase
VTRASLNGKSRPPAPFTALPAARDTQEVEESVAIGRAAPRVPAPPARDRITRPVAFVLCWGFFLGNIVAIVWIWVANHNLPLESAADVMSRLGGLAGLLGAYLALIQVLLLARLPWLERLAGFDRLTVWHRWNGYACLIFVVAHSVMAVYGYALGRRASFLDTFWTLVGQGALTGMVTATIGAVLFVIVAATSVVIVKRRLPYELWYAVHLSAYAAIALAWFHEIPVGGDITPVFHPRVADYWRVLFWGTVVVLGFRLLIPVFRALRYRLRVVEVTAESPTVTSLRISGRGLHRLRARPGQFFIWRFLTGGHWWTAHPFSLSAAPDGRTFRISAKAAGDHTARMGSIPVGTRVVAEGPFGSFTEAVRRREKVLLIAGGIGITPIRALAETIAGDVVLVHRVMAESDLVFVGELERLAEERSVAVHIVVGDHAHPEGAELLSPAHLRDLVPDLAERDVYLCGPPAMIAAIRRNLRHAGVSRRHLHVERFAL